MPHSKVDSPCDIVRQYRQAIEDCRALYLDGADECGRSYPDLIKTSPAEFRTLMADLFRGLVLKIYFTVVEADGRWSAPERDLGAELLHALWRRRLDGEQLREAMKELSSRVDSLSWFSLIRPFDQIAPLRSYIGDLETVVMRMANLVAKVDGDVCENELPRLRAIQRDIQQHLHPLRIDEPGQHDLAQKLGNEAVEELRKDVRGAKITKTAAAKRADETVPERSREELLAEATRELEGLIGLDCIKDDVRSLVNFLRIQEERQRAGLPKNEVSLHMLFYGNPGTGKTTVARIVGKIFSAMGILAKGHLIETDRSGMVAGYVGQTAIKAGKKIDEAMDGVLFIDEAYSLVSERGDDAYGPEAIQTLLKRMEDDRKRLVVILAGYPTPMDRLLGTNPGLASRFSRKFDFPDYSTVQLAEIFQSMCEKNHYVLPTSTRAKLLHGFQYLRDNRDENFGNGRLVRNVFESSIRRLANRVAAVVPLTKALLTTLEQDDIAMATVPDEVWDCARSPTRRYRIGCPGCQKTCDLQELHLGRRVRCRRCGHRFRSDWGEPVNVASGRSFSDTQLPAAEL